MIYCLRGIAHMIYSLRELPIDKSVYSLRESSEKSSEIELIMTKNGIHKFSVTFTNNPSYIPPLVASAFVSDNRGKVIARMNN